MKRRTGRCWGLHFDECAHKHKDRCLASNMGPKAAALADVLRKRWSCSTLTRTLSLLCLSPRTLPLSEMIETQDWSMLGVALRLSRAHKHKDHCLVSNMGRIHASGCCTRRNTEGALELLDSYRSPSEMIETQDRGRTGPRRTSRLLKKSSIRVFVLCNKLVVSFGLAANPFKILYLFILFYLFFETQDWSMLGVAL